jgi:hypothetical protein
VTEQTTKEATGLNVVVLGQMNPAIHHPAWYKFVKVLSDEEEKEALKKQFVFVPQMAQFKTGSLQFYCDLQRWQVSTTDPAQFERILKIAGLVFDEHLPHTPVNAMGLNFLFHRLTLLSKVGQYLGSQLAKLDFKFRQNEGCFGKLSYTCPVAGIQLRVDIEESRLGQDIVYLSFNAHIVHEPKKDRVFEQFGLGKLIAEKYAEVQPIIDAQVTSVLEHMRKAGDR